MKANSMLIVCAASLSFSGAVLADTAAPPKPGPEHQKLGYFVGKWKTEGDLKPSPFGPGGKMSGEDKCEWFDGKYSVVCRSSGTGPAGPTKGLGILSYSDEEKAYTYYGIDNTPMTQSTVPRGAVQGDTWTYTDESKMGGKMVKSRYIIKVASPSSYAFKFKMQGDDGKWNTVVEGTETKVEKKSAEKAEKK